MHPPRHLGPPGPEPLDDRGAVDRQRHGAADARIGQLRVRLVEGDEAVVGDQPALHLEGAVALDLADLVGRDVAGEVVLAGEQPGDAAGDLRHLDEADAAQRRPAAPVVVEGLQQQGIVRPELGHAIGPGADGPARPGQPAFGLHQAAPRDDDADPVAEPLVERRVRPFVTKRSRWRPSTSTERPGKTARPCARTSFGTRAATPSVPPNRRSGPKDAATSSASISSPLWKRTPGRSSTSTRRSSSLSQRRARPGRGCQGADPVGIDQRLGVAGEMPGADVGVLACDVERIAVGDLLHRDGDGGAGVARLSGSQPRQRRCRQGNPTPCGASAPAQAPQLFARKSMAKAGAAFQRISRRLAVKVAFRCSTV